MSIAIEGARIRLTFRGKVLERRYPLKAVKETGIISVRLQPLNVEQKRFTSQAAPPGALFASSKCLEPLDHAKETTCRAGIDIERQWPRLGSPNRCSRQTKVVLKPNSSPWLMHVSSTHRNGRTLPSAGAIRVRSIGGRKARTRCLSPRLRSAGLVLL